MTAVNGRLLARTPRHYLNALLYGAEEAPAGPAIPEASSLLRAAGYAMLRAPGAAACLRFGMHGGGHGHDRDGGRDALGAHAEPGRREAGETEERQHRHARHEAEACHHARGDLQRAHGSRVLDPATDPLRGVEQHERLGGVGVAQVDHPGEGADRADEESGQDEHDPAAPREGMTAHTVLLLYG